MISVTLRMTAHSLEEVCGAAVLAKKIGALCQTEAGVVDVTIETKPAASVSHSAFERHIIVTVPSNVSEESFFEATKKWLERLDGPEAGRFSPEPGCMAAIGGGACGAPCVGPTSFCAKHSGWAREPPEMPIPPPGAPIIG